MSTLYRTAITVFMLLLPCLAMAGGGIYFDDLAVANNGNAVYSDSFDDGNVSDWTGKNDTTLSYAHSYSVPASFWSNRHTDVVASAYHNVNISNPGIVEANARVWLPPVEEQYGWTHTGDWTCIFLSSGSSNYAVYGGIDLRAGESGYRVILGFNLPGGAFSRTASPVLQPGTWSLLTVKMNNSTSTAYAYLDGIQQCSIPVDASYFLSYDDSSLWGRLGDGVAPVPEPSGLLALGSALPLLGGFLLRRRR